MNRNYILKHTDCDRCVFCENGFYNYTCAHCPNCHFGKKEEPSFMTRDLAEFLGVVGKKGCSENTGNEETPALVPVRHGHWIRNLLSDYWMHCSVCDEKTELNEYDYCPHCGAKMDSEEKNAIN